MKTNDEVDQLLIERIRAGDGDAWKDLIDRFEGRLLAFVDSRLNHRSAAEDVVQECFVGFLNSLPNYDGRRSLESYLFSICAYKLTDYLRREGRRPAIPMALGGDSSGDWNLSSSSRVASSIARSTERRRLEHAALLEAIRDQVAPPTINLDNPGAGCDLNFVPHVAQKMPLRVALSNSFGFGGTNGTLLFRQFVE